MRSSEDTRVDEHVERRRKWEVVLAELLGRQAAGEPINRQALAAEYPQFTDEIALFFEQELAGPRGGRAGDTIAFAPTPRNSGSRGLQIRCPHCSNPVELLVDTAYEDITCGSCGSRFNLVEREEPTRLAAPLKKIGRFELISRLGLGGFGTVWKARDTELDRTVAIKIPRKGQLGPGEVEQFFREARAAAQLRHPNIVPVHEVGREGDTIFIVCDYVRGVELGDWLTAKSPNSREAAALCRKVAIALHHAHESGVVHRDLKPSNIMVDDQGEPHLMDFGLAKREVAEVTMTVDGQILGTPAYMSPEQAAGRSHWTDRRTDIYSLGVILYRMLTGELPFRGNAQMQVYQRLNEEPEDPRTLNRHIPRDAATICLKCLERDPNRRYPTALSTADELDRFLQGTPIQARPISHAARVVRWARRKPALATAAGLIVFLAIAGPLAAVAFKSQQASLEQALRENENVIMRYQSDKQRDVAAIETLSDELDVWEGRANPFSFWPPKTGDGVRQTLLKELYAKQFQQAASRLERGGHGDWQRACGHVGLALLADGISRKDEAIEHWTAASQLLSALAVQDPQESSYALALADCHRQLARLAGDNRGEAERRLAQAAAIYESHAHESGSSNRAAAQMEVAMDRAVLAGFDGGQKQLELAATLQQDIARGVADDPVRLYQVACMLSRKEPLLALETVRTKTGESPAVTGH